MTCIFSYRGQLFQLLQIYEFLSKSQRFLQPYLYHLSCFSYCKYMNF